MAVGSSGQNRYVHRGFGQELFGQDGFDLGPKFTVGQAVHAYPQNTGQGYGGLGWNGYQAAANIYNPYQKIGYATPQNQGFVGGSHLQQGFAESVPGQLQFGVSQPAVPFVGNRRIRVWSCNDRVIRHWICKNAT